MGIHVSNNNPGFPGFAADQPVGTIMIGHGLGHRFLKVEPNLWIRYNKYYTGRTNSSNTFIDMNTAHLNLTNTPWSYS